MTREEKIQLLKSIQEGKHIKDMLPSLEVTLIEDKKGTYIDLDRSDIVPAEKVEAYIQKLSKEHPKHLVKLLVIPFEEFERLSFELEIEY